MKAKTIIPREQANRDADAAIAHYLGEDAKQAALGFIDALERAYAHIGRHPAIGSSRYPQVVVFFYVERPDHIDVWRVLHGQRDIPAWMQEPDGL